MKTHGRKDLGADELVQIGVVMAIVGAGAIVGMVVIAALAWAFIA